MINVFISKSDREYEATKTILFGRFEIKILILFN